MTMTISEKVAYLKGLAEGMELEKETSKEGKLIGKIIEVLEDVGLAVEDLEDEVEAVGDELDAMSEDLSDVESTLFEEDEDGDSCEGCCFPDSLDAGDDDFFEIACPSCGEDIVIDESILDAGEVTCPNCGDKFSLDLTDEATDGDEE